MYIVSLNSVLFGVMQCMGEDIATEAQKCEVTCPGPHSWSEAKLDLIQSHPPLGLGLPFQPGKNGEFSLLTIL